MRSPSPTVRVRPGFLAVPPLPAATRITKPGLAGFLAACVALLLAGCELFSTREFSPRPGEIRPFAAAFAGGDSVVFRVTETLGSEVLARKRLRFSRAPESSQGSDGWTAVAVTIREEATGEVLEEGVVRLRQDGSGIRLAAGTDSSGGARYFPLKVAASAEGAPADTAFLALPPAFTLGGAWLQSLGVLEVAREIESVDTLRHAGRLEESWRVSETILDGSRALARGSYWYGASGLLRAEQTWILEQRGADGFLRDPAAELRREMTRL